MVETVRVTVTAHRDGRSRYLDVQVRDIGRPAYPPAATVTLEEEGSRLASTHTDAAGKASLAIPRVRCFDLRIRGGWAIPVLLRFRG